MGPGMPHFVVSLQQAGCQHVPAVASGSHCLSRFSMQQSLHGAIKHAWWHDVWTNATHDDRDLSIAHMLTWQRMRMNSGADWPFQGQNLYALIAMGLLPCLLQSFPHAGNEWLDHYDLLDNPPHAPTPSEVFLRSIHEKMAGVSDMILKELLLVEEAQFQQFWCEQRAIFEKEFESRCQYNEQQG